MSASPDENADDTLEGEPFAATAEEQANDADTAEEAAEATSEQKQQSHVEL